MIFPQIILSTNEVEQKKVVLDFRHHSGNEINPPLKLRPFFTHNFSKNRHMKYDMVNSLPHNHDF